MTLSVEDKIVAATTIAFGELGPVSVTESIHKNLREIHTVDPNFIDFAHRLLTTGTATGREEARLSFTLVSNYIGLGQTRKERHDSLRIRVNVLTETMHEKWSCANVMEESGEDRQFSLALFGMRYQNESLSAGSALADNRSDAYWRGLAILALVLGDDYEGKDQSHEVIPFLEWAGHHHNASDIVRTGIDRGITDLKKLRETVEAKSELSVPVQGGYL